jgi:hypothetical protein
VKERERDCTLAALVLLLPVRVEKTPKKLRWTWLPVAESYIFKLTYVTNKFFGVQESRKILASLISAGKGK